MKEAKDTGPVTAILFHILGWATGHAHPSLRRRACEVPPRTVLKTAVWRDDDSWSATISELNTKPYFTLEKQPKFYACGGRLPARSLLM